MSSEESGIYVNDRNAKWGLFFNRAVIYLNTINSGFHRFALLKFSKQSNNPVSQFTSSSRYQFKTVWWNLGKAGQLWHTIDVQRIYCWWVWFRYSGNCQKCFLTSTVCTSQVGHHDHLTNTVMFPLSAAETALTHRDHLGWDWGNSNKDLKVLVVITKSSQNYIFFICGRVHDPAKY